MESPNTDVLRSSMCSCCPCPHFSQAPLIWEVSHTKAPSSRFFMLGWLGCHSNSPGRNCLRTLQVPGAVDSLWHHNQYFHDCLDCISTPSKASPPPAPLLASQSTGEIFWYEDHSFPLSVCPRFNLDDISVLFHRTPNLDPSFSKKERVSSGEYKNSSSPLQCNQPGKLP
jgi:hypothetical protein